MSDEEIDGCYTFLDLFWIESMGAHAGLAHGLYHGRKLSFEEAQENQRRYILQELKVQPGTRAIDIGCGYGHMLKDIAAAGGAGKGITLSRKQTEYCRRRGLDVVTLNWKDLPASWNGQFDCVVANGSLEHFVSPEEVVAGKLESIYEQFFARCHELLDPGSDNQRLFTSFIFQKKFFDPKAVLGEYVTRDEYMAFLINKMYGGGWYPYGFEQVLRCASRHFRPLRVVENTRDYLETYYQVRDRTYGRWGLRKAWRLVLDGLPLLFRDRSFLYRLKYCYHGAWGWQFEGDDPPMGLISITFERTRNAAAST